MLRIFYAISCPTRVLGQLFLLEIVEVLFVVQTILPQASLSRVLPDVHNRFENDQILLHFYAINEKGNS